MELSVNQIKNVAKVKKDKAILLIIDMQNDFVSDGAAIQCDGGLEIVPNIQKMKAWAKKNGIPVIYTQESHRPQRIDFGVELERNEPEHCIEGTWGHAIINDLKPDEDDYVMIKRRYSAFYMTDLEFVMRGLGRDAVIICGCATNVCVYASALDAMQRDMYVVALSDCCAGTSKQYHENMLKNLEWVVGDVADSETVMEILDGKYTAE